jgi:hypothetical protein
MAESKANGRIQGPWQNLRSMEDSNVHGRIQGPVHTFAWLEALIWIQPDTETFARLEDLI